jgi:hypothetical protein
MYAGFSRFGPALAGVVSRAVVGVLAGRWRWADRAELLGAGRAEAAKVRGASAMVAGLGRALGGIGCELGVGGLGRRRAGRAAAGWARAQGGARARQQGVMRAGARRGRILCGAEEAEVGRWR